MIIKNSFLAVQINEKNGTITSINNGLREFIHPCNSGQPLFTIRLRDLEGRPTDICAVQASVVSINMEVVAHQTIVHMNYSSFPGIDIQVQVEVKCPEEQPFTYWRLSLQNNTNSYVDWIDFPNIIVPDDLVAAGGNSVILWPAMEGVLVDNADYRDEGWLKYSLVEYPNKGWEGYYPGPCPIQMMAYYDERGGMYFAAHDNDFNVKAVEYYRYDGGIKLEFRLFPGGVIGSYEMNYDMVVGTFSGDWHDAADIYRTWREQSGGQEVKKLNENTGLPEWLDESPVIAIYPIRGQMHMGDMTPNQDFFPFTNALPIMKKLAESFESKVLALPMQWEGTAPWAPPYVWPPLGGEEDFKRFVDSLHDQGNLAGVYCSGIAWSNESLLVPEYSRRQQFNDDKLINVMCDSPEGENPSSAICQEPIRAGYDMCPSNRFVHEVAVGEVSKIVKSGCDYIQFFDQNLGGASYFCYSRKHGHPPAPGKWQIEAMKKLMEDIAKTIKGLGRQAVIGCEAAAAEPYMANLPFNDLRFEINYMIGRPVPLYAYIYHQYANNFMGNQNMSCSAINFEKSPMNILQRTAYSFIAGDMLSVVLSDGGRIHWDWCTPWNVGKPDQEWITELFRNLNSWRKGIGRPFLRHGKMQKPYELKGCFNISMVLYNSRELCMPSLFTSRWISPEGRNAQIVVNYTPREQKFSFYPVSEFKKVIVCSDASGVTMDEWDCNKSEIELKISALSAIMLEFI